MGISLGYQNGVKVQGGVLSDLWLTGDIRHMELLQFNSGIKRILVSRNNGKASVYSVGNHNDILHIASEN
jgi:hypothetical protein